MDIASPEQGSPNEKKILEVLKTSDAKVDAQYENLTKKNKKDDPKLGWKDMGNSTTSDERIIRMAQIIAKYQEYGQRLASKSGNLTEEYDWYKREVARNLVSRGEVNSSTLLKAIEQAHGRVNPGLLTLAVRTIGDYVRSGHAYGGTGLPQFPFPQK